MAQQTVERENLDLRLRTEVQNLLTITRVESDLALASLIERGLPTAAVESLMQHGMPEAFIYDTIVPRRTYHRRRQRNERLTADESDRAERAARVLALATFVFDDETRALRWLAAPKRQFEDRAPLQLLRTKLGAGIVEESLLQSYYGIVA